MHHEANKQSPGASRIIGVDIGGTNIRAALFSDNGSISVRVKRPTEATSGRDNIVANIADAVRQAAAELPADQIGVLSVGVPGPVNPKTGVVYAAASLPGWRDVPVGALLKEALGLPILIDNDANMAALGETAYGAARGYRHVVYLTVSTGIGAGVIVDGKVLIGARGVAGEVGHMTVDPRGKRCPCGNIGCLSMLASGSAIQGSAAALLNSDPATRGGALWALCEGDTKRVTAELVAEAARLQDPLALRVLEDAGRYLGIGITNLLHGYNPEIVVLGGGASQMGPLLLGPALDWVADTAMPVYREGVPIVAATLGDDAGLYGAYAAARAFLETPALQNSEE